MTKAPTTERSADGSLSTHNGFSLISNEKLLEIYSTMLKCRMLEERIHVLGKNSGKTARPSVHIAAIAGAAIDLLPGDTLAPSPGAFIPCFVKGLPLASIFSIVVPRSTAHRPRYSALNVISPSFSLAKQIKRALEAAALYKAKRNKKVVIVFSSDASGASSEHESALKVAAKKKLPMLFVCETKSQDDDRLARAKDYDFPGVVVEDDDAVAIYRVATEAITHARRGSGPTLIECRPWPLMSKRANGVRQAAAAKHPKTWKRTSQRRACSTENSNRRSSRTSAASSMPR